METLLTGTRSVTANLMPMAAETTKWQEVSVCGIKCTWTYQKTCEYGTRTTHLRSCRYTFVLGQTETTKENKFDA